jgi:metallo-beta-lactamase class B
VKFLRRLHRLLSRCRSNREAPRARSLLPALIPALAILAAPPAASAAEGVPREDDEAAAPHIEIHELRPGVWIHVSYYEYPGGNRFPSNGLIVRDGDGLILVDTAWGELSTLALLGSIEDGIGLPVRRAVLTHSHYDRLAGADVLEARGVEVLAHPLTQQQAAGQGMPMPDETLTGLDEPGADVTLGAVEVFYPGPGHAPDNLMVWLPSERVLFGGCAVRALSSASLGAIADADVEQWAQAIRRSLQRYAEAAVVVPGHGETGDRSLLDHTVRLLEHALSAAP